MLVSSGAAETLLATGWTSKSLAMPKAVLALSDPPAYTLGL
jgi:hypothetical protein